MYYEPKIWSFLPSNGETSENLKIFTEIIKNWNGFTGDCSVCQS